PRRDGKGVRRRRARARQAVGGSALLGHPLAEAGRMEALATTESQPLTIALRFGPALALGVLLRLERERTNAGTGFAGVPTFGLLALAGAAAAFLDSTLHRPWLGLAVFAAVAALVVVSYAVSAQHGEFGITTELSAVLAFVLGFLCVSGHVMTA